MKINSAFLIVITLFFTTFCLANIQEPELRQKITNHIEDQTFELTAKGYRYELNIGTIDPRLSVGTCDENLTFEISRSIYTQTNNTIKASCRSIQNSWKIFVPFTIEIFGPAVVSSEPILKGSRIDASMLRIEETLINKSRQPIYTDINDPINMVSKKNLKEGKLLTPSLLSAPRLVNRGDQVTIVAQNESIYIKMSGTALTNGKKGQQIRVKNNNSNRIVKATVLAHGKVAVTL